MAIWGFYGRRDELEALQGILRRGRWFFVKITGRRRIGKTTLIQQALQSVGERPIYYVQIPDSGEAGVISAVNDALEAFQVPQERYPRPRNLAELAKLLESLAEDGYVVVLDEFQYFNRKGFEGFAHFFKQQLIDWVRRRIGCVAGGWSWDQFTPKWLPCSRIVRHLYITG